jgi:hypothetical protein
VQYAGQYCGDRQALPAVELAGGSITVASGIAVLGRFRFDRAAEAVS